VREILEDPALFAEVFAGLIHHDPRIRMRAADALEKVSSKKPELLQPFKAQLMTQVSANPQQEVQWHVAQMFAYLDLNDDEQREVVAILYRYLDATQSNIVKVSALQTLAEIAHRNRALKPEIVARLQTEVAKGSAAIVSRGRKLLARLSKD
jgi:hypothetical protein